jgi:hypothetical protein
VTLRIKPGLRLYVILYSFRYPGARFSEQR